MSLQFPPQSLQIRLTVPDVDNAAVSPPLPPMHASTRAPDVNSNPPELRHIPPVLPAKPQFARQTETATPPRPHALRNDVRVPDSPLLPLPIFALKGVNAYVSV